MKNDDVMDLIVVFCILFAFMLVLYCFCVATEFSVNKDLYEIKPNLTSNSYLVIYIQCLCYLALPLCIVSMHLTRCVL